MITGRLFRLIAAALLSACTTFSNVRSADVEPGPSMALQVAATTSVGPETGWFWAFDCAQNCGHAIPGADFTFTYGLSDGAFARHPVAFGGGVNGTYPYIEGYLQLSRAENPFGVGARVGIPAESWNEHEIYLRQDIRLGGSARLLINPEVFIHHGRAPNGASPGSFVGFVQGLGILLDGERVSYVPAVSIVVGRAERNSYGQKFGPERSVFGTASVSVTVHRRKSRKR